MQEDKQKQKKEEGVEEKEKEEGGEGKRRAAEDLSLEEIRPLPPFKRINGLEVGGDAFGHILMTVQFINNFKNTLEFGKFVLVMMVRESPLFRFRPIHRGSLSWM